MTPYEAYCKAHDAGKRLPELENIIMTSSYVSQLYAKWVIKGKLPEKMHNMMILHGIKNSNDIWVKSYFEFIK